MFKRIKLTKKYAITIILAAILISMMISIKFKPAYAVTINNELIGYVNNKEEFQEKINKEVLTSDDEKVAFVSLDNVEYSLQYVNKSTVNEEDTLEKVKENSKNIYRVYEITNGDKEDTIYVASMEEAENIVSSLKQEFSEIETDLAIGEIYLETEATQEAIDEAKSKVQEKLQKQVEEKEKENRTVNGIYLACLPVTGGSISSRYGAVESIRDHTHGGLDIAASYGTPIKAAAAGTVSYSGVMGGYGNLIIIDHGNGITTYYGHCSELYATEGQTVEPGDVVAAVGSTGNSTGNHCHFEIRIDGDTVNPQNYLYNNE